MKFKAYYFLILSLFILSCHKEKDNPEPVQGGSITFNFRHLVEGESLQLSNDGFPYTNAAGNPYRITTLKYYISKLSLYNSEGQVYDVNMYKLINFVQNTETITYQLSGIPSGTYTKVSFLFGIDSARNILFGLGNNPQDNEMEWPFFMGGGYHFMKMEGAYRHSEDTTRGYAIHLGRTPNQALITFTNLSIKVDNNSQEWNIDVNIDKWFDGPNVINLKDGYASIMEDSMKQALFKQNAQTVFNLSPSK